MPEVLILLVEDEEMIRIVLEESLHEAGYLVQSVADGAAAVERLEAEPERYRALLTDIRLPGELTGWDIAHRARELSPTIPVIYVSGDSAADWSAHGVPNSLMLTKPFAIAQVVTAVSQMLNAVPPVLEA